MLENVFVVAGPFAQFRLKLLEASASKRFHGHQQSGMFPPYEPFNIEMKCHLFTLSVYPFLRCTTTSKVHPDKAGGETRWQTPVRRNTGSGFIRVPMPPEGSQFQLPGTGHFEKQEHRFNEWGDYRMNSSLIGRTPTTGWTTSSAPVSDNC